MKARWFLMAGLLLLLVPAIAFGEDKPAYLDPTLSPEVRTEDLLSRMTLREKLGQMVQIDLGQIGKGFNEVLLERAIVEYGVGSILSGGSGSPMINTPEGWAKMANEIQRLTSETRLKIPVIYGVDAVHGHNAVPGATIYPHNLGIAATFNQELAQAYAAETAEEVAATGLHWTFAPVLDVARDPRWGRTHETLGEDPYTVAEMGKSLIIGFQSSGKIIACGKHYLGYSAPNNGMDRNPADFSERTLREIHLPPYQAAIQAGLCSIMVNSGEVNGEPAHASKYLLTDVLRGELGFTGLTVSDYEDIRKLWSIHKVAPTRNDALALAHNAGVDMSMEAGRPEIVDLMESLVEEDKLPVSRVDEAVRRILMVKFRLGLFERQPADPAVAKRVIGNEQSRRLARQLASQSLVLLRNPDKLLPLSKQIPSILVVGPAANGLSRLCGGWTIGWQGARDQQLTGRTVLEAVKGKVSPETKVTYIEDFTDEDQLKEGLDEAAVVLAVVGEKPYAEWYGDSQDLALSYDQQRLLKTIADSGKPTVIVAAAGRPLIIDEQQMNMAALLWAFLPGTEGGEAIADVIFGDVNPSGRLPITFPARIGQLPMPYTVKRTVPYEPLFPFGYGLSYTQFKYSAIQAPERVKVGENITITVKIKNIGKRAGDEVVMLFVRREYASVTTPLRSLQGFARVSLAPGEEKTVKFQLTPAQISILNPRMKWVEEPGDVGISIGGIGTTVTITE